MNPKQRQAFGRMFAASMAAGNDNHRSVVMALKVAEKVKQSAQKHFEPLLYIGFKDSVPQHEGNCGMDDIGIFTESYGVNLSPSNLFRESIVKRTGSNLSEVKHFTVTLYNISSFQYKNLDNLFKFLNKFELEFVDVLDRRASYNNPAGAQFKLLSDNLAATTYLSNDKKFREANPELEYGFRNIYKHHNFGINVIIFSNGCYHKLKNAKLTHTVCVRQNIKSHFISMGFEARNENYTTSNYN